MGTTAYRALRYPEGTDRVADGALAIRQLAEDVDTQLRPFVFRGRHTGGQVVGTGTVPVAATLDAEDEDTQLMHAAGSAVTIPAGGDGLYLVSGNAAFPASATGNRSVMLLKNDVTIAGTAVTDAGYGTNTNTLGATPQLVRLVAGDTIKVAVWQTSGANMNLTNATLTLARVSL